MDKTREKVRKIIKESFEANVKVISWDGMHDVVTDKIMGIIKKKVKKSENKSWLAWRFMRMIRYEKKEKNERNKT